MKYNLIGIDPSIISTAMVINSKVFNYCRKSSVLNKKEEYTKWFELCKNHITYKYIDLEYVENYSANEIQKLKLYNKITDNILLDINDNLIDAPIKILIEGYSYSSSAGDLIDLVTFSTLLRNKLLSLTGDIGVVSPTTLKLESCKLTYPPKDIGKKKPKFEYRNNLGVAGGSFSKVDMFMSLIDNNNTKDDKYCNLLRSLKSEIIGLKTIKKPLEDCNDAYLLYLLSKSK